MKHPARFLFILLTMLLISACGSSSSSSSKPDTSWFEGGTLHRASVKEWRAASYSNRLATAADFVAASQDVDYSNLDEFKNMAIELEKCISVATSEGDVDNEDVALISVMCSANLFP